MLSYNQVVVVTLPPHKANDVAELLAAHGISSKSKEWAECGAVSVSVDRNDIPSSISLIQEFLASPSAAATAGGAPLLIPVDFSSYSDVACRVGFEFARRLNLSPVILHAYPPSYFLNSSPFNDDTSGIIDLDYVTDNVETEIGLKRSAQFHMNALSRKIKELQAKGDLPEMPFSTVLREGVPEESILDFVRLRQPRLVVMATRGLSKKKREMVGSVTAEVLDSCRCPMFTVPEEYHFPGVKEIQRIVMFCNLDRTDLLTIKAFNQLFDFPEVEIVLVPVNSRADTRQATASLLEYCTSNYPAIKFRSEVFDTSVFREATEKLVNDSKIQLLLVPNKKTNVFRRLFNPGIAHKILFERDIPMLVLPV